MFRFITTALLSGCLALNAPAQTPGPATTVKHAIEIAGLRIGTQVSTHTVSGATHHYTQTSNVEFWFFGKIRINYKTSTRTDARQLLRSEVEAHTNRGDFLTTTAWQDDHYDIRADQYKYTYKSTETQPIDFSLTRMYFEEPVGRKRVYAEYFGKFATIEPTRKGSYIVRIEDREDEYFYEKGQLVKIVKENSVKNFILKRVD
ncbi:DUF6134 family protein [Larkinella soli]|uniref:DUF6134 family protein n=1 Tax=Larkinella soli TaxID=1770527 RepID=UPI000FFB483A|nr:DUF6134 family protein [Larkinella soli]